MWGFQVSVGRKKYLIRDPSFCPLPLPYLVRSTFSFVCADKLGGGKKEEGVIKRFGPCFSFKD